MPSLRRWRSSKIPNVWMNTAKKQLVLSQYRVPPFDTTNPGPHLQISHGQRHSKSYASNVSPVSPISCSPPRVSRPLFQQKIYYTLRQEHSWPQMVKYVYQTSNNGQTYPREGTTYRHQRCLNLFPATSPLEFVAMDITGPLPKSSQSLNL